jgi:hypothetical protein
MGRWLEAVRRCAERDVDLARELARSAQLVKGYGDVRRRMAAVFDDLLGRVTRAFELESSRGGGFAVSRALARRYRALVLQGPDGETHAATVAADVLARLEAGDPGAALAALG